MHRILFLVSLALVAGPLLAQRANPAGPDQFICGNAATMQADPLATGETGVWTIVQGTATFANQSAPGTLVLDLSYGENVLRWTIYPAGGSSTSDLVSLWCYNDAMPDANAGPDQTATLWPGSVQLAGSAPIAPGACYWIMLSGSGTIADPTDPGTTVGDLSAGTIVLEWSCDNGPCGTSSDMMSIDVAVGIDEPSALPTDLLFDPIGSELRSTGSTASVLVCDATGRVVAAGSVSSARVLSLAHLPPGLYTVRAESRPGATAMRIVLE